MKKPLSIFLSSLSLLSLLASPVSAHRSGCHSWHSCPSDTGSYTCGDKGYCSECSDNQYCEGGAYSPVASRVKPKTITAPANTTKGVASVPTPFVGKPKTFSDLHSCLIVDNGASKIYHLKGSKTIKQMNLKGKTCFATEAAARGKGYRRGKI